MSLGIPDQDVSVHSDVGGLPGWVVGPEPGSPGTGDWAVLVHGSGARKEETLRAVPVLREAGWTCLVAAYRNDRDAPPGPDGRYNLGLSEWRDVDAALGYAVTQGARRIVLFGWSMGAAIVLQCSRPSSLADLVVGVVLDSPVLDWAFVLATTPTAPPALGLVRLARAHGLAELASAGRRARAGRCRTHRLGHPVRRAEPPDARHRLRQRRLRAHRPRAALAQKRPDLVPFERWQVARHCKEWNVDPERWERVVRDFVASE